MSYFTNSVPHSNFAYSANVKPRPLWYIRMEISAFPPTLLAFYCHRANNSTKNFTNISIVLKGVSPQYFILFPL